MRRHNRLFGEDVLTAPLVSTSASLSAPTQIPPRSVKTAATEWLDVARPTKFHLPGQKQ